MHLFNTSKHYFVFKMDFFHTEDGKTKAKYEFPATIKKGFYD